MNISIPLSWIQDYIEIKMPPEEMAKHFSLHAFNVEKIEYLDNDPVFEIEVTPNRADALSILGIAREMSAVLPEDKIRKKRRLLERDLLPLLPKNIKNKDHLEVEIKDSRLVPHFAAIVLDNVKIANSPRFMAERLPKVGFEPINNIVDITNYLMIDRGQPMHAFDFDKIKKRKMILRESRKGEEVITLDGVKRVLPSGIIVIEDGEGRLIDLCGIMGAKNSEIDLNTKKVLLFIQVYDPIKIRKASMSLGHRTEAALRFEKGIDREGVLPSLWEACKMAQQFAQAQISSDLVNLVHQKKSPKKIVIDYAGINMIAGLDLPKEKINYTLRKLGFKIHSGQATVPSWRQEDININEDLAEEVIRVIGYHNIPTSLPIGIIPSIKEDPSFYWEKVVRNFLKHTGFNEIYTYSFTSKKAAGEKALKITNPLSKQMSYLKTSLTPGLIKAIKNNKGAVEKIKVFELAQVYLANGKQELPKQPLRLAMAVYRIDYLKFKGIIEALLKELGIPVNKVEIKISENVTSDIFSFEIDFSKLLKYATKNKKYKPISRFNSIKEDFTLGLPQGVSYEEVEKVIKETSKHIHSIEFKSYYKNFLSVSIQYLNVKKQINSKEAKVIRAEILKRLQNKLHVELKQK